MARTKAQREPSIAEALRMAREEDERNRHKAKVKPKAKAKRKQRPKDDLDDLIGEMGSGERELADMPVRAGSGRTAQVIALGTHGVFLSVHQFSRETNKDRANIMHKITKSDLMPKLGPNGQAMYRLKDLIELVFMTDDAGNLDVEKLDPFKRKAHYAAELDKLRLQQESGELVPALEVEQEQARILKTVAHFFDTLPDVMERDCGLVPDVLQKIERRLDLVREDLYKSLTKEESNGEDA